MFERDAEGGRSVILRVPEVREGKDGFWNTLVPNYQDSCFLRGFVLSVKDMTYYCLMAGWQ